MRTLQEGGETGGDVRAGQGLRRQCRQQLTQQLPLTVAPCHGYAQRLHTHNTAVSTVQVSSVAVISCCNTSNQTVMRGMYRYQAGCQCTAQTCGAGLWCAEPMLQ